MKKIVRRQQKIWENEHKTLQTLPSMASEKPSEGVIQFIQYFQTNNVKLSGKTVDIGCGKGRNTIYLAQNGFHVYGLDYVDYALQHTYKIALQNNVVQNIHLITTEIDKSWPFLDNYFDCAIDCYSSIDIETKQRRRIYRDELLRTIKPGGYALIMVPSIEDEWESRLIREHPGKEKNSTYWPQSGKFQKDYEENELRKFYTDFKICALRKIRKKAFKLGKHYNAENYWMVLQKE
ncbi:MAG TPA: class I SAM-dependent methyltransferase [Patescibacteria group bacterium]|nr:class I SAM-dependent methyltransferase [Patescibacteria group bacterium]